MQLGWIRDGFPIYGLCQNEAGVTLKNCWAQIDGTVGDNEEDFYHDVEALARGDCHLNACGGMDNGNDDYRYYATMATAALPMVPACTAGTQQQICGFSPRG